MILKEADAPRPNNRIFTRTFIEANPINRLGASSHLSLILQACGIPPALLLFLSRGALAHLSLITENCKSKYFSLKYD